MMQMSDISPEGSSQDLLTYGLHPRSGGYNYIILKQQSESKLL